MSKEVKRWDELKALAEGMDGWPNKNAFEFDDAWCVGAIDEDENLWPVIEIQTEQYDAFDAAEPMAKYYAAANPPAILKLLAERDALLAERDRLREALNYSCKSLCKVTSSDGSGHADIALAALRLAGVGADEREALVEGWKANVQWRIDRAALQGAQP